MTVDTKMLRVMALRMARRGYPAVKLDVDAAAEEIDELRSHLSIADDEVDRLRQLLADAPHEWPCPRRRFLVPIPPCTCWKDAALEGEG